MSTTIEHPASANVHGNRPLRPALARQTLTVPYPDSSKQKVTVEVIVSDDWIHRPEYHQAGWHECEIGEITVATRATGFE